MNSAASRLQLIEPWLSARASIAQELITHVADQLEPEATPLRTPSALKACALGGGKVELRWAGQIDHRVRYVIQRWTAAKGWSDIAAVPGHRTSYVDSELTPYTTCALRVLAEGESGRSLPSNIARAAVR